MTADKQALRVFADQAGRYGNQLGVILAQPGPSTYAEVGGRVVID